MERNYKEWAKHIIEKFGKKKAKKYSKSGHGCPCVCFENLCYKCIHKNMKFVFMDFLMGCGCQDAKDFWGFPSNLKYLIKKEIKKIIKNEGV